MEGGMEGRKEEGRREEGRKEEGRKEEGRKEDGWQEGRKEMSIKGEKKAKSEGQ